MNRYAPTSAMRYANTDPDDGRYGEAREKQLQRACECIAEEYSGAIAFGAKIEALAKEADAMLCAIPANEYTITSQSRTTWREVAGCLRDVIEGQLLADEKSLETLADMRVTGEG